LPSFESRAGQILKEEGKMIYTMFGSEIKIEEEKDGRLLIRRKSDGKLFRDIDINYLKADEGIKEIQKAIESCNTRK